MFENLLDNLKHINDELNWTFAYKDLIFVIEEIDEDGKLPDGNDRQLCWDRVRKDEEKRKKVAEENRKAAEDEEKRRAEEMSTAMQEGKAKHGEVHRCDVCMDVACANTPRFATCMQRCKQHNDLVAPTSCDMNLQQTGEEIKRVGFCRVACARLYPVPC